MLFKRKKGKIPKKIVNNKNENFKIYNICINILKIFYYFC
jgi:hypothetical protein